MSRGSKKTAVWYNGRRYVWDDLRAEFVRWIRNRFGRPVCKSYRDDLARLTSNKAAQFVGNAVEAREPVAKREPHLEKAMKFSSCDIVSREEQTNDENNESSLLTTLRDSLDYATLPRGFKVYIERDDLIKYAKKELEVEHPENFYGVAPIEVINAVNAELFRAYKMFEVRPHITEMHPFTSPRYEDWAEHLKVSGRTGFRTVDKWGNVMDAECWRRNVAFLYNDGQTATADWRHIIRHEIGHTYFTGLMAGSMANDRTKVYAERTRDYLLRKWLSLAEINQTEKALSTRAIFSVEELIAESFSVVLSGVKDNDIANDVVQTVLDGYKK